MFDAMADWMAVPLMQYEGGQPPRRIGLAHTSIAPYGVFKTADGVDILISIQSDREWRVLAAQVLGDAALAADPAFATNVARVKRRADTDAKVQAMFGATDADALTQKLAQADIAFARVNDTATLAAHPQLRRIEVATPVGAVSYPAPAARRDGAPRRYGAVPALGEHRISRRAGSASRTPRSRPTAYSRPATASISSSRSRAIANGACWPRRCSATRRWPPIPCMPPMSRGSSAAPTPTRKCRRCSAPPTPTR